MSSADLSLEIAVLYDEFAALRECGKVQSVEDFIKRHPDKSSLIREYLGVALATTSCISEPEIPQTIAGHRIQCEIGRGGMGIVYRARQRQLERDIALKVIPPDLAGSEKYTVRFKQEALSASRLDHPNIVSVFDYGIEDGTHWLTMPLIEGQSLDCKVTETDPTDAGIEHFRRIAQLGADVASALAHAHENKTVHRDIKPSNLLLDNDGKVWVTDFGLAKIHDIDSDLSKTGEMIGTPRYMAPEQVMGIVDGRCDVYSLGITLWELCAGRPAWDSVNRAQVLAIKEHGVGLIDIQDANPQVPNSLASIIMTACAYDPDNRYQTAKELQHVLNRFAHGEKVVDRRARTRQRRTIPRYRQLIAMAILGATVTFCLLTLGQNTGKDTNQRVTRDAPGADTPRNQTHELAIAESDTPRNQTRELSIAESDQTVSALEISNPYLEGPDTDSFQISDGALLFSIQPDFESPSDTNGDGVYEVTVNGDQGSIDFIVRVTDANDPPLPRGNYVRIPQLLSTFHMPSVFLDAEHDSGMGLETRILPELQSDQVVVSFGPEPQRWYFSSSATSELRADGPEAELKLKLSATDNTFTHYCGVHNSIGGDTPQIELGRFQGHIAAGQPLNAGVPAVSTWIDVASSDGDKIFAIGKSLVMVSLYQIHLNFETQRLEFQLCRLGCGLPMTVSAIATCNGRVFFGLDEKEDSTDWVVYELIDDTTFRETERVEAVEAPQDIQSLATVDGRFFQLYARQGKQTVVTDLAWFPAERELIFGAETSRHERVWRAMSAWQKSAASSKTSTTGLLMKFPASGAAESSGTKWGYPSFFLHR